MIGQWNQGEIDSDYYEGVTLSEPVPASIHMYSFSS